MLDAGDKKLLQSVTGRSSSGRQQEPLEYVVLRVPSWINKRVWVGRVVTKDV
jgi:hypothetical protein